MLSQRCDIQDVEKDINSSDHYYVEVKFDGERFQIHYGNNEYKYFSRYKIFHRYFVTLHLKRHDTCFVAEMVTIIPIRTAVIHRTVF